MATGRLIFTTDLLDWTKELVPDGKLAGTPVNVHPTARLKKRLELFNPAKMPDEFREPQMLVDNRLVGALTFVILTTGSIMLFWRKF
jgi:hypothetical protein